MAFAIREVVAQNPICKVLVLEGYKDGLISYGADLNEAFAAIKILFQKIS